MELQPSDRGLLGKFGRDLTSLAQAGEIQPAVGQYAHKAMIQLGLILQQSRSNNPILLGDSGVGKTAIVEGFAWRLARDPEVIQNLVSKRIVELPMTALLAGSAGSPASRYASIISGRSGAQRITSKGRILRRSDIIAIRSLTVIPDSWISSKKW